MKIVFGKENLALIGLVQIVCSLRQGHENVLDEILESINMSNNEFNNSLKAVNTNFISSADEPAPLNPALLLDLAEDEEDEDEEYKPDEEKLTAIVVREGSTGDGDVARVILTTEVPTDLDSLAGYGSQVATEIAPDICLTDEQVVAIFDEMNPPDEEEDDEEDEDEDEEEDEDDDWEDDEDEDEDEDE